MGLTVSRHVTVHQRIPAARILESAAVEYARSDTLGPTANVQVGNAILNSQKLHLNRNSLKRSPETEWI